MIKMKQTEINNKVSKCFDIYMKETCFVKNCTSEIRKVCEMDYKGIFKKSEHYG